MTDFNFLSRLRRRTGNPRVFGADPPNNSGLVWRVDPDIADAGAFVTGPAGTLSTPVQTSGARGHYTYGITDVLTYGDSLDTTWTGGPWTVYLAHNARADDPSAFVMPYLTKFTDVTHAQFGIAALGVGGFATLYFAQVFYAGDASRGDGIQASRSVSNGRHVLAITFDPALARASRLGMFIDGAPVINPATHPAGADGTMSDTTAVLSQGKNQNFAAASIADANSESAKETSYIFAYSGVHTTEQIAENVEWFKQKKGQG